MADKITITKDTLHIPGAPDQIQSPQIEQILMTVYIIAGMAAVITIIIGGIRYATSAGDSSGIQSAKNTVQYAVVGLVVILAAAAITDFVIKNVAK